MNLFLNKIKKLFNSNSNSNSKAHSNTQTKIQNMSSYEHYEQVCGILNIDINQLFESAIMGKLLVNPISSETKQEITNIMTNGIQQNERMTRNELIRCQYFSKLNAIMNCEEREREMETTVNFAEDTEEATATTTTTTTKKRKKKKKKQQTPLENVTELNNIHDLQGYKAGEFKDFLKSKKLSTKGKKDVLKDRVYRFITNPESITDEDKSKRGRKKKTKENTTQNVVSEEVQNIVEHEEQQEQEELHENHTEIDEDDSNLEDEEDEQDEELEYNYFIE